MLRERELNSGVSGDAECIERSGLRQLMPVCPRRMCNLSFLEAVTWSFFLDLLDHEDATIGVMASQIILAMHDISGDMVEDMIQKCPDGMNKLLQRLPRFLS